ncbi:hypothetical protein [Lysobacter sp. GCM10012299]|uniref:DUF7674 family protein n=1 Tax=Lysobacter sp. GCM10012299 TaxID=3317333 RepID=UPI003618B4AF
MDLEIINTFLAEILTAFPEVRARMECHDDYMTTSRMEEFARATTDAFSEGNTERAVEYLAFMSKRLANCSPVELEYMDVYYVESLFWPHGTDAARVGWQHVPENLKELFVEFHGRPPL